MMAYTTCHQKKEEGSEGKIGPRTVHWEGEMKRKKNVLFEVNSNKEAGRKI